jgi:hypothetical protein
MFLDDLHQFILSIPDYLSKLGFALLGEQRIAGDFLEITCDVVFFKIFYGSRSNFSLDRTFFFFGFHFGERRDTGLFVGIDAIDLLQLQIRAAKPALYDLPLEQTFKIIFRIGFFEVIIKRKALFRAIRFHIVLLCGSRVKTC